MWTTTSGDTHDERLFSRTIESLYKGESMGSILLKSSWRDRVLILQHEKQLMDYLARFKQLVGEED